VSNRDPIRKVPTARQLVTSLVTSLDYDVILVTSQYSKSSHSEPSRINCPCRSFKQTLSDHCV